MYEWYSEASECFVHLSDVTFPVHSLGPGLHRSVEQSKWFTRGWTLQELLAPRVVVFCNAYWEVFGHMSDPANEQYVPTDSSYGRFMLGDVADITKISSSILSKGMRLDQASIAQRMSWASHRTTTRVEDEAYCLLGIFGINMPLLYGEGKRAFLRLQEEIIRRSTDQSLLAWGQERQGSSLEILADSPRRFRRVDCRNEQCHLFHRPYALTNNGLQMRATLLRANVPGESNSRYLLSLNYSRSGNQPTYIPLRRAYGNMYVRRGKGGTKNRNLRWKKVEEQLIYLRTGLEIVTSDDVDAYGLIDLSD